jgi:hypothetical protein
MQKSDGVWTVTPEGLAALSAYAEPEVFWKQAVALYTRLPRPSWNFGDDGPGVIVTQ